MAARREKEETERKDRLKRGMLTGWEIFMESATNIVDDDTAAGAAPVRGGPMCVRVRGCCAAG